MITQTQYKEIMKEYDQKRILAEEKHKRNLEKIYTNLPLLKTYDEEISQAGLKAAKVMLTIPSGSERQEALLQLENRVNTFLHKRKELLSQYSLLEKDLRPKYQCPLCEDTGYIQEGEAHSYIREKCKCLEHRISQIAFQQSNLHKLQRENFDTFELSLFRNYAKEGENESPLENMKQHLQITRIFVDNFDKTKHNLLFSGQPGLGKTFLCNCIAEELLHQNKSVLYFTSNELIDIFAKFRFAKNREELDLIQAKIDQIYECDLLIIDDLGTEMQTAFSGADLFNVINTRMNKQKKIIVSTNLFLEQIDDMYSTRLGSRLSGKEFVLLEFFGDDLRKRR